MFFLRCGGVYTLQVARDYQGLAALVRDTRLALAAAPDLKGTVTLAYYPDGKQVVWEPLARVGAWCFLLRMDGFIVCMWVGVGGG